MTKVIKMCKLLRGRDIEHLAVVGADAWVRPYDGDGRPE
jgi:hypothetical protein